MTYGLLRIIATLGSTLNTKKLAKDWGNRKQSGLDEGDDRVVRWTGTGDWAQSFYPRHLTMGEGGAVNIIKDNKRVVAESFETGEEIAGASGVDNT